MNAWRSSAATMVLAGAGALLAACADPTEVVVFVDTTLGVPCQISEVEVRVVGDGPAITRTADLSGGPQSLTVLREGGGSRFSVEVRGLLRGQVVAEARAEAAFESESRQSLVAVLDDSCRTAACDFSGSLSRFTTPRTEVRRSCQGISSRYSFQQARFIIPENACSVGVQEQDVLRDFNQTAGEERAFSETFQQLLAEQFSFRFFGEPIQRVTVADDGYVAFSTSTPATNSRGLAELVEISSLSGPGAPRFSVTPFWDDLRIPSQGGEICAALLGAPDLQTLWITWNNACFQQDCTSTDLTFSVGLEENTNRIVLGYLDMVSMSNEARALGQTAVVGIRGPGEPGCSATQCSSEGLCSDGQTPCNFTQIFARQPQDPTSWPTVFQLTPVPES